MLFWFFKLFTMVGKGLTLPLLIVEYLIWLHYYYTLQE